MQYVRLGRSGLKVSRIALGCMSCCMSYGDPSRGFNTWSLDQEASQPFFRQAVELGIDFWDTANVYQFGRWEEFVGRAVKRYTRRENVVLATKVYGKMYDGPGGQGLSRRAIMEQIDGSLTRLGTDFVDVYLLHRFDAETPVAETMEALTTSSRQEKPATSGPRRCSPGSSPSSSTLQSSTVGRPSSRFRTSTTCSSARRNARCSRCAQTWESAACLTRRWPRAA